MGEWRNLRCDGVAGIKFICAICVISDALPYACPRVGLLDAKFIKGCSYETVQDSFKLFTGNEDVQSGAIV